MSENSSGSGQGLACWVRASGRTGQLPCGLPQPLSGRLASFDVFCCILACSFPPAVATGWAQPSDVSGCGGSLDSHFGVLGASPCSVGGGEAFQAPWRWATMSSDVPGLSDSDINLTPNESKSAIL